MHTRASKIFALAAVTVALVLTACSRSSKPTQAECAALDGLLRETAFAVTNPIKGNSTRVVELAAGLHSPEARAIGDRALAIFNATVPMREPAKRMVELQYVKYGDQCAAVETAKERLSSAKGRASLTGLGRDKLPQYEAELAEANKILKGIEEELTEAQKPLTEFKVARDRELDALRAELQALTAKAGK